jgi:hypothetical protein
LFKWETQKKKRVLTSTSYTSTGFPKVPPLRINLPPPQTVPPLSIHLPPKKTSPKKVAQKLIAKFPFGKKKKSPKKLPKKLPKTSMMVRILLEKLKTTVIPIKKTKMLADPKNGITTKENGMDHARTHLEFQNQRYSRFWSDFGKSDPFYLFSRIDT